MVRALVTFISGAEVQGDSLLCRDKYAMQWWKYGLHLYLALDHGCSLFVHFCCSKLEKQKEKKRKEEQKRKIASLSFNPEDEGDEDEDEEDEEQDCEYSWEY